MARLLSGRQQWRDSLGNTGGDWKPCEPALVCQMVVSVSWTSFCGRSGCKISINGSTSSSKIKKKFKKSIKGKRSRKNAWNLSRVPNQMALCSTYQTMRLFTLESAPRIVCEPVLGGGRQDRRFVSVPESKMRIRSTIFIRHFCWTCQIGPTAGFIVLFINKHGDDVLVQEHHQGEAQCKMFTHEGGFIAVTPPVVTR